MTKYIKYSFSSSLALSHVIFSYETILQSQLVLCSEIHQFHICHGSHMRAAGHCLLTQPTMKQCLVDCRSQKTSDSCSDSSTPKRSASGVCVTVPGDDHYKRKVGVARERTLTAQWVPSKGQNLQPFHRQWWRLQMGEMFSSGTINSKQTLLILSHSSGLSFHVNQYKLNVIPSRYLFLLFQSNLHLDRWKTFFESFCYLCKPL